MKLWEAEHYVKEQLQTVYEEQEASNITGLVLEQVTGLSKTETVWKREQEISEEAKQQLDLDIERLKKHEPIQYVMNKTWFYGMELYVDKNVLIPRPETEELVKWIVDDARETGKNVFVRSPVEADETTLLKVLDVGTGS